MPSEPAKLKTYELTLDEVSSTFFHVLNCYIQSLDAECERYRTLANILPYHAKWAAGMIKHLETTKGKLQGTFMTILAHNSRPDWIAEGIALATIDRKANDATVHRLCDMASKEGLDCNQDGGGDDRKMGQPDVQ